MVGEDVFCLSWCAHVVLRCFVAHYEMPFDVVRDDIQKSVKETVKQIRKRFAERSDLKGDVSLLTSECSSLLHPRFISFILFLFFIL